MGSAIEQDLARIRGKKPRSIDDDLAAIRANKPKPAPEPEPPPARAPSARLTEPSKAVVRAGTDYVRGELKAAGHGIVEQARDIVRPGGIRRAAVGLAHGVVDPVVTMSQAAFEPPVVRQRKRGIRALETAEAARRANPGEFSEDIAEEAVAQDERRKLIKDIASIPQVASMAFAPGISGTVGRAALKKMGAGAAKSMVKRAVARAAGESAAGATFGATMDPAHPIAGAASMAVLGPVIGETMHAGGKVVSPVAGVAGRAAGRAAERARGVRAEIAARTDRVRQLETKLVAETDRRASAERAADFDELTGIANKRAFKKALPTAEKDANTAIVRFDVNGFKAINDVHGHAAGDNALVQIPSSLTQAAAELGVPERVFRVGGDEFAAIVPKDVAAAFRDRAEELYGIKEHGRDVKTSISGGIGLTDAAADAAAMTRKAAQKAAQGINGRKELLGVRKPEAPGQVNIERINIDELVPDPERFQYKQGKDAKTGSSGTLSDVDKFDESLAGVISAWRDPETGVVHPVNGHNRVELAKRSGHESLNVQMLPAKSAAEARTMGALQNIAEGRGTAIDAAQFFRDSGKNIDELRGRVPLTHSVAKNGIGLSKLAPDVFSRVVRGEIPEGHGAAIGDVLPDMPEMQRTALKAIESSGKRLSEGEVREVARQVRDAGSESVTEESLFGTESIEVPLYVEKAQLAAAIQKRLAGDRRLFGYVAKEGRAEGLARAGNVIDVEASRAVAEESAQLEEVFRQLYTRKGPIADAITDAARRVANGEKPGQLVESIYPAIKDAVQEVVGGRGRAGNIGGGSGRESGAAPDELGTEAVAEAGRVTGSADSAQDALFAPRSKPTVRQATGETDLFGNPIESEVPAQSSMFGDEAGTAGTRNLAQTEVAARSELEKLHALLPSTTDTIQRATIAGRIAELEKLVNRGKAITPAELATRAVAEHGGRKVSLDDAAKMLDAVLSERERIRSHLDSGRTTGGREITAEERANLEDLGAGTEDMYRRTLAEVRKLHGDDAALELHREMVGDPDASFSDYVTSFSGKAEPKQIGAGDEQGALLSPTRGRKGRGEPGDASWEQLRDELVLNGETDAFGNPVDKSLPGARDETGVPLAHWTKGTTAKADDIIRLLNDTTARAGADPELDAIMIRLMENDLRTKFGMSDAEIAVRREQLRARPAEPEPPVVDADAMFSPAHTSPKLGAKIRRVLGKKAPPVDDVKALITISRELSKAIGANVRQGRARLNQRKAAGVFFTKSEAIRVRRLDDVATVMHENGHLLSKLVLGNPTRRKGKINIPRDDGKTFSIDSPEGAMVSPKLPKGAGRELVQMGKNLYGSRKPALGYGEEGIAEYFSFYVTEPHRLAAEAPIFDAFVQSQTFKDYPVLKAAFDQARQDFTDYTAASSAQRIDAMISVNERVRNWPTARSITTSMLDDLNEFKLAVEELGGTSNPTENAYTLARLTRGDAGAGEEMIQRGIVNFFTKQRVTRGAEEILREIPRKRLQSFRRYLAAERTIEVAGRGVDSGMTLADAYEQKNLLEAEFGKPAAEVWGISQALIDYRRDAGLLTDAEASALKRMNQKRVGFYRVFEPDETAAGGGSGRSFGRNSSGLQKMKGSARPIIDPLESLVTDIYRTVHQANTHNVLQQLVKLARRTEGGGKIIEVLTEAPKHRETVPTEDAVKQLADLGFDITQIDQKTGQPVSIVGEQGHFNPADVLEAFHENRVPGPKESKDLVIPFIENGERLWIAIKDRRLYDAIRGLDRTELAGWMRLLEAPTRMLRVGATNTPEFIGRNPVRDAWTAAIYSQGGFHAPGYDFARGIFSFIKQDAMYQRWRLEGGDNAAMLGLDRAGVQKSLEQFLRSDWRKTVDLIVHPLDTLRLVSSAVMENATRIGEDKSVFEKRLREGVPEREAAKGAADAARNVTLDFARSGVHGRQINRIIAFFNANVQGTAKLMSELRHRPEVVLPRIAVVITLPSIVLHLLQKDDPAYQEIPRWLKDISWIWVHRGDDGNVKNIFAIPKPPGIGVLFGSVPERLLEWAESKDPKSLDGLLNTIVGGMAPAVLPTGLAPLLENWANKSFFLDRPIVPRGMERLPAEEQATKYTSETARALGRIFDYSPAKIDNLVRGFTGGLGSRYVMPYVTDPAVRGIRKALGKEPLAPQLQSKGSALERVPGVRGFVQREPGAAAESVEHMYRRFEKAEARRAQWKELIKAGKAAEARIYFKEWRNEIKSVVTAKDSGGDPGPLRAAYQEVTKIRGYIRAVEAAKFPDEEKQRRTRALYDRMIAAARASNPKQAPARDPAAEAIEKEASAAGVTLPDNPAARRAVARLIGSPEYRDIPTIAEEAVRTDPKYRSRAKKSLTQELKAGQIENAIRAASR